MRHSNLLYGVALVAAAFISGCGAEAQDGLSGTGYSGTSASRTASLNVPSGTAINVTLATALSSETASVGTAWNGSVSSATMVNGRNLIPAGSPASGTVSAVKPAVKGDRAMLDLALTSVTVNGRTVRVHGSTESVVAGSTRARNLGAIAGSAAGGALIGQAVSGSGKGAVIGGIVGGGVATGVVAASDGYQVVLKPGIAITFMTSQSVAVRP